MTRLASAVLFTLLLGIIGAGLFTAGVFIAAGTGASLMVGGVFLFGAAYLMRSGLRVDGE